MSQKDGSPAFPVVDIEHTESGYPCGNVISQGMSLREWFAGMSLSRLVNERERTPEKVAELAYGIADALIAADSKSAPSDVSEMARTIQRLEHRLSMLRGALLNAKIMARDGASPALAMNHCQHALDQDAEAAK